jgi:BolA protein
VEPADRRAHIEARLREGLAADHVQVIDESHLHAGHEGARSGGGHFQALIVSDRFEGRPLVQRQRMVFEVLAEEMEGDIHALSMRTFTPEEWARQS